MSDDAPEKENASTDDLPEKYRGKSAAEIARMHMELESKLGEMGRELGELRSFVTSVTATREQPRTEEYVDRRWSEVAEELFTNPEHAVRKVADKIRQEVLHEVTRVTATQLSAREQLEQFFRANPDLDQFREVVAVIGERLYQQNPSLPFDRILDMTAREARQYIASLKQRLERRRESTKDAVTTGGTQTAREAATGGAPAAPHREENDPVMEAIRELHEWRKPRLTPPR